MAVNIVEPSEITTPFLIIRPLGGVSTYPKTSQ